MDQNQDKNQINKSPAAKDAFTGGLRATDNRHMIAVPVRSKAAEAFSILKAFGNDRYWINAMLSLGDLHKRHAYELKRRLT